MAPLRRAVVACDQSHAVNAAEVAINEGVPRLRLLSRPVRQPEMPLRVLVPAVGLEEAVLVLCARLDLIPLAAQDVLAGLDQLTRPSDAPLVDRVRGHAAHPSAAAATRRPRAHPPRRRTIGRGR